MRNKRKLAAVVVVAVAALGSAASGAWALLLQSGGGGSQGTAQKVYDMKLADMTVPTDFTELELFQALEAYTKGDPLPTGFSVNGVRGRIETNLTGFVDPVTGDVHSVTTIIDHSIDVDTATLSVDGQVIVTATRANGGIIDRSGKAIATISAFIPPALGHTIKVEWSSADGMSHQSHEVQR